MRVGIIVSACLGLGAINARAAGPDELCRTLDDAQTATQVDPAALRRSTEAIEKALAVRGSANRSSQDNFSLLDLSKSPAGGLSLRDLAAYCSAAGELMRTSTRGTEAVAQLYLLTAFRMAEVAGDPHVASRAAYRLGLVSLNAAVIPSTRGQRRLRTGTRGAVRNAGRADQIGDGVCGALTASRLDVALPLYLTSLALRCASIRSLAAQDYATAALAHLRIARIELALLEKSTDQEQALTASIAQSLRQGFEAAGGIAEPPLRAEMTGRLAETALDSAAVGAEQLMEFPAAMRAGNGEDPAILAYAAALEARLMLARGDQQGALAAINRAIFLEAQRPVPLRLPEWYLLLAVIDPDNRTSHSLTAYRALEAIRPLLPSADPLTEESTFSLRMRKVFEQAVDVTLASIDPGDADAGVIIAAQTIIETYREAEIQSLFGSECVPPRIAFAPSDLVAGEVLLYPVLLANRLELIVAERPADGGPARYRRLPPDRTVNRKRISALVEQVNIAIGDGVTDEWRAPARQLDALLIEPIAGSLAARSTLIVIPDGALRALPFAALLDAQGRFLVERTRLGGSPALGYSQPGAGKRDDQLRVVAASLQKSVEIFGGTFPALEGTAEEARIAAAIGTGGGSRLIEDFRRDELADALRGGAVDILHLATHASFNGGSNRSFIVANDEAIPLSDLRQMIAGNLARGGALDLIVLSACETAVGDDEASMGLAGAAIQAGAASAIASLWQVNDAGTAELMRQFYSRYAAGQGKAEALRDAQLALLATDEFADPNIWAAFTLLGAWR